MNQSQPIVIPSTAQASVQSSVILSVAKDPIRPATLIRPNRQFSRNLVILKRAFSARFRTYALPATLLVCLTALAASASAQTLTGTVKNVTTGKPGAGDDVVLITLSQGMEEAGRTKADAKGNFSFKLDQQGPHLIRVIHQDVTYHRMAPPGTTSVEVEVYDVGKKVEGIEIVADIMRFQAGNGNMQVDRTFAVQNNSKPPRTQMNEHNLEFFVPEGAKITEGQAMTAGGQPVKSNPAPEGSNTSKYSFLFPLRPGETRFNVVYTMPYTGSVNIDPKSVYPLEHFVAIAPKAMQFAPATDGVYKVAPFPGQPDANVEVASNTRPGQSMAFKLTGEGELAAPVEENGQSAQSGSSPQTSGPGGGLGPPIDAPDPLQKYRWWILGGIAAVLVIGGVVVASRQQAANRAAARAMTSRGLSPIETDDEFEIPAPPAKRAARPAHEAEVRATEERPSRGSSKLLEGLKEELFELEVEHKQGRITQQEYEQTKAALDQTLQRALKRESQKA